MTNEKLVNDLRDTAKFFSENRPDLPECAATFKRCADVIETLTSESKKRTIVVSAFPACGKTYFSKHAEGLKVLDSDSSSYRWINNDDGCTKRPNPQFPQNYIHHIKMNLGVADFILVSTHNDVRKALRKAGINYLLVYPRVLMKDEWIMRCQSREYNGFPISLINDNWYSWIETCNEDVSRGVPCIRLASGMYLSDCLAPFVNNTVQKGE